MADGLLIAVASAERLRRRRLLMRQLRRVVPAAAGLLFVAALLVRLVHAPLAMFWIVSGVAVAGVGAFVWMERRVPAVTDAAAARLDADASLGGELRSAHWFASHDARDPWTTYHLGRAAEHVEAVSWPSVYPPVKTARAWAGSAALMIAAIAVVLTAAWPGSSRVVPAGGRGLGDGGRRTAAALPADLQKEIDDLIKAVQKGSLTIDAARAKVSQLRDAVADLDPKAQAELANAMKGPQPSDWNAEDPDPQIDALAKRAEKAAAKADLPQDLKWSLQDLAEKLSKSGRPSERASSQAKNDKGDAARRTSDTGRSPSDQQIGIQMMRNTSADAQSTQVMTTNGPLDGIKVDPRGAEAARQALGQGAPIDLSALRKETIQADAESQGANVLAEMRRKSEQSHSTLAFTHVAPLAAYDKSRASAPPAPPDALRPLVKQYFIRR